MFTTNQKRWAIMAGGTALLVLVILFVFNPLMKANTRLGTEVDTLRTRHRQLADIRKQQDKYESETSNMQEEITAYTAKFPAEVRPEDAIVLSMDLEAKTGAAIHNVEVSETEQLSSMSGLTTSSGNATGDMSLMRTMNTMSCACSYDSLKNLVSFLKSNERRMTIDTINMSFDEATGGLTGSIAVNMYSMTNTNASYESPGIGGVKVGKPNIFGTVN